MNIEVVTQFNTLAGYIDEFKEIVEKALGRETVTPIDLKNAKLVKEEDFYAGNILESVQKDSAEFVAAKREEFLNGVVTGKSEVAQKNPRTLWRHDWSRATRPLQ